MGRERERRERLPQLSYARGVWKRCGNRSLSSPLERGYAYRSRASRLAEPAIIRTSANRRQWVINPAAAPTQMLRTPTPTGLPCPIGPRSPRPSKPSAKTDGELVTMKGANMTSGFAVTSPP